MQILVLYYFQFNFFNLTYPTLQQCIVLRFEDKKRSLVCEKSFLLKRNVLNILCVASSQPCVYDTWTTKVAILPFQFLLVAMDGLSKREEGGTRLGKTERKKKKKKGLSWEKSEVGLATTGSLTSVRNHVGRMQVSNIEK